MKSEERHKLKTNEFAETLQHVPDYLRQNGANMALVIIVVLMVVVGVRWYLRSARQRQIEEVSRLQSLLVEANLMELQAARQAQAGGADEEQDAVLGAGYDSQTLAARFGALASDASGDAVGAMALVQQAAALQSQWLFAETPMTAEDKARSLDEVAAIYEQALKQYPKDADAQGLGQLGLAIVAEERGQWAEARQRYGAVVAEADALLAGTVYPARARQRLDRLDELQEPVIFAPAQAEPARAGSDAAGADAAPVPDAAATPTEAAQDEASASDDAQ